MGLTFEAHYIAVEADVFFGDVESTMPPHFTGLEAVEGLVDHFIRCQLEDLSNSV